MPALVCFNSNEKSINALSKELACAISGYEISNYEKPEILLTLKIERNSGPGGRYVYAYSRNEIPLEKNTGIIGFELVGTDLLGVHDIHISGHVCSRPDAIRRTHIGTNGNSSVVPSQDTDVLGTGVTYVCLAHALLPLELIHIGLIISIQETPHSKVEVILCDPQVGNGPPPAGGGGRPYSSPRHDATPFLDTNWRPLYQALKLK